MNLKFFELVLINMFAAVAATLVLLQLLLLVPFVAAAAV